MLRIPHCLDNQLTDGGEVVSCMHRSCSTPQKYSSASGTCFCWRLSKPQGLVQPEGLGKVKKFTHLIGSPTCDLPAFSTVPRPLRYRELPHMKCTTPVSYIKHCKVRVQEQNPCQIGITSLELLLLSKMGCRECKYNSPLPPVLNQVSSANCHVKGATKVAVHMVLPQTKRTNARNVK
jgi:hypothetical protein